MQFVLVAGVNAHLAGLMCLNVAASDVFAIPALVTIGALSAYLLVIGRPALPFMHKAEAEGSAIATAVLWTSEWVRQLRPRTHCG
jgi:hypothetical protein